MTQAGPISVPPGFNVEWGDPQDEQMPWMQDRMHLPNALTPLDRTMVQPSF